MARIVETFGDRLPLLANMVEGGATPVRTAQDLEAAGFSIAIFPGGIVRALAHAAGDYYQSLAAHGSNTPFKDRMYDFDGLNAVLGTPEMLAQGDRYSGEPSDG
jgi:2-methylisocitrate lyase-like PEP mutase family enzyme